MILVLFSSIKRLVKRSSFASTILNLRTLFEFQGDTSRYFQSFLPDGLNFGSSVKKPKNNGLLRNSGEKHHMVDSKAKRNKDS